MAIRKSPPTHTTSWFKEMQQEMERKMEADVNHYQQRVSTNIARAFAITGKPLREAGYITQISMTSLQNFKKNRDAKRTGPSNPTLEKLVRLSIFFGLEPGDWFLDPTVFAVKMKEQVRTLLTSVPTAPADQPKPRSA
jgi:hypothetical protein